MKSVSEALQQTPFPEAIERFARRFSSMEEVWDNCPRSDWMLWMLENLNVPYSRRGIRIFICKSARRWWSFLPDIRSQRAVEAAEKLSQGQLSRGALEFIRDGAEKAAVEAAASTKPILSRAARLVVLALSEDLMTAAKEAAQIAAQAEHAINETLSDEHEMQILFQQANELKSLVPNPFNPAAQTAGTTAPATTVRR